MTNSNRQISVDELDFDAIKSNLKDFLRGQTNFTDFEYEGSALSTLIDILAYNTHYNALYTNLAVNEMFIDSASKLSSVTSLAKTIGYTPKSTLSATATIDLQITNVPGNPLTLTLPKNTAFKSEVNGKEYTFLTYEDVTTSGSGGVYLFSNLNLIQGSPLIQSYIVSDGAKFVIPDLLVDMTKLSITVYEAPGNSLYTVYNPVEDILRVKGTDTVYFVKQREDLYYEIFFGDDSIGKRLSNGNLVIINYYGTDGAEANGCRDFYYAGGFMGEYYYNATTVINAQGGSPAEERDSIKYNAPRYYKAQHRAVTAGDYEVVLKTYNPTIESVRVWGGETNVPPVYGKVFISAKPLNRSAFTTPEKDEMIRWLRENRTVLTVLPEFVDASTLNVELSSSVYYNPSLSNISPATLMSNVISTITDYSTTLNRFNENFLYSQLVGSIDDTHPSITNNITTLRVRSTVTPYAGVLYNYTFNFANPIKNNSIGGNIWSTRFLSNTYLERVYFRDEADGTVWLYTENIYGIASKKEKIGEVDYSKGVITFTANFRNYYDSLFEIVFNPQSYDIVSANNYIVSLPMDLVTVKMISSKSNITSAIR